MKRFIRFCWSGAVSFGARQDFAGDFASVADALAEPTEHDNMDILDTQTGAWLAQRRGTDGWREDKIVRLPNTRVSATPTQAEP